MATRYKLIHAGKKLSDLSATTSAELAGVISDETGSGALVFANTPTLVTPLLGTPTSGTLTNCTGLPIAGLVSSTSTALGLGSIELGHATDTTLARVSAGVVSIEGVNILTTSTGAAIAQTFYIGTTQVAINRASAALTLAGITLTTPDIGTPSAGTLTNCTGLPIAGLTASTSTALGVGSIELGHASDTTIARVSAGVISVEGVTVDTISATNTLTNKRITKRVVSATSYTTDTGSSLNADTTDVFIVTAQAGALKFNNPSGTPTDGQTLWIAVTGTAARALTWDTAFEASTVALPTTTVTTARLDIGFVWNVATSKWRCIAAA